MRSGERLIPGSSFRIEATKSVPGPGISDEYRATQELPVFWEILAFCGRALARSHFPVREGFARSSAERHR